MKRWLMAGALMLLTHCGPGIPGWEGAAGRELAESEWKADAERRVAGLIGEMEDREIFEYYNPKGDVLWSRTIVQRLDFSGVAWDDGRTATLISPEHALMAAHYARPEGHVVAFHDRRGKVHLRKLVRVVKWARRDLAVGRFDRPLPQGVRVYRVLPPGLSEEVWKGMPLVVTEAQRRMAIHEVERAQEGILFLKHAEPAKVPERWRTMLVGGSSGNPSFAIVGGELVVAELHTFGGAGAGPNVGDTLAQDWIQSAMDELGGGRRLMRVPLGVGR